ncbi:hypothetical protein FNV43_RR14266 [Rhamnella rubrinervis]|uniref:Uncharacterized protein n=1 Tax=Rhamnella rubrinervis TaxID=2594499 RepID=A0A8K0MFH4_9ROSA|nr:hypothetical protein FNV43_RR14266 [Rhamnella rubrinervis]
MSFGILRRLLNLAASNSKSIQLRRFLNTAAYDSKLIRSGNGKLDGGSQCTALWFPNPRDFVMVEDASERKLNLRRAKILMTIAVSGVYMAHELVTKANAEDLKREFLIDIPKEDEATKTLKEYWRECFEKAKISKEKTDKEYKLLLEEFEALVEELKETESVEELEETKSDPNI